MSDQDIERIAQRTAEIILRQTMPFLVGILDAVGTQDPRVQALLIEALYPQDRTAKA
jgi:hypothetical protein